MAASDRADGERNDTRKPGELLIAQLSDVAVVWTTKGGRRSLRIGRTWIGARHLEALAAAIERARKLAATEYDEDK